jgi:hypothetical protein
LCTSAIFIIENISFQLLPKIYEFGLWSWATSSAKGGQPHHGTSGTIAYDLLFFKHFISFFMVVDGTQVMILTLFLGTDHMSEPLLGAYYLLSLFCLSKKLSKYVKITHYLF